MELVFKKKASQNGLSFKLKIKPEHDMLVDFRLSLIYFLFYQMF